MDITDAALAARVEEITRCSSPTLCCQHGVLDGDARSFHHHGDCAVSVRLREDIALRDAARREHAERDAKIMLDTVITYDFVFCELAARAVQQTILALVAAIRAQGGEK